MVPGNIKDKGDGMTAIAEVAYIRLGTRNVGVHASFAGEMIGLQKVPGAEDEAWFRSDIRRRTLVWFDGAPELGSIGIAYSDPAVLDGVVARLEADGVAVQKAERETCERLFVRAAYRTADPSGNRIDLVLGPHHSGRRFFPARDNGIKELEGIGLRSTDIEADTRFWTKLLGFEVRDWVSDICFIGMDDLHHRIALYPSSRKGVLSINLAVEDLDLIMQNKYYMQERQVKVAHGPGRQAASGQIFLQVEGPEGLLYGFVTETARIDPARHRPRQFSASAGSLCTWGSRAQGVAELAFESQ